MNLIPKIPIELKQILKSLPGVAVHSISYPALLRSMAKTGTRFVSSKLPAELVEEISSLLPAGICLTDELKGQPIGANQGELFLSLYFSQLKSTKGIFLDLGAEHFATDGELHWKPSKLWYDFSPEFLQGLRGMYQGYYEENKDLFATSLDGLGLTAGCNDSEKAEVRDLFYAHFGGDVEGVRFSFTHFFQSFSKIFEFLNKKNIKIPIDFVYLGIYLTTLYQHLSKYDRTFNVKKAYFEAFK
jgi:hypothetical protein